MIKHTVQQTGVDAATAQKTQEALSAAERALDKALQNVPADVRGANRHALRDQIRQDVRDAIRGARDGWNGQPGVTAESQDPQIPPIPPVPPVPPFSQSDIRDFNTHVAPEIITAIRETAPRVVSMLSITLVLCVVGFPLARAFARWIDRRGAKAPPVSPDMDNRLRGIEQAVESIALEVERISEGQRFTTKLLNDRTQQPAPDFRGGSREREMASAAASPLSSSKL